MSSAAERIQPRPARWPWVVLASFLLVAAIGLVLVAANDEPIDQQIPYVIAFSMFGAVGALIVSRDRRNTIGLLCLYASFLTAISFLGGEVVTRAIADGQDGWWLVVAALLNNYGWLFGILPTVFLMPLLFPNGHLPSSRWRPFLWFIVVVLVVLGIDLTLGQKTLTGSNEAAGIANPLYVDAVGRLPKLDLAIAVLFPGIFGASLASLILRFRRSTGVERQQVKWVVFGLGVALVGLISTMFSTNETILSAIIGGGTFLLFPLSLGVAILRFHLYDLDVVLRKTVIFATVVVSVTAFYLILVVVLPTAVLGVGSGVDTGMVLMGVAIGLLVSPIRNRARRFANRIVYGNRATPYEVLSEFSERVGGAYSDEDVLPRMVRILGEGVGAERADVWLAVDDELRDVAAWPDAAAGREPITLPNGSVPPIDGMDRVYPVEQAGELLGALAVRKPANDPITHVDEKLIADLAAQAGLVLRNVRLSEALKLRLSDLQAAQKRLVSAQDAERRRLERNIHDGAQQQLVALAVKLKLADDLVDRDTSKARSLLGQLQGETHAALEDLRDLARGIYPPLLADKGLASALEAQARKSGLPIEVRAESIGRYPQDVEAAVYFSCLEAIQNIAKYAEASAVSVSISERDHRLRFAVVDDGCGFDPAAVTVGTGLQGIADRLGALDGEVTVTSAPGRGTTVEGMLPVPITVDASA